MPKLITLVEDEFIKLRDGAEHLCEEVKTLVEKLAHYGCSPEASPQSLVASAISLKAHIDDPATLLAVPSLAPIPAPVALAPPVFVQSVAAPSADVAPVA
jgi:hypothetical protein